MRLSNLAQTFAGYNYNMNINNLKNKQIKVYGKTRALSADEFIIQMQQQNIILADEMNENVSAVFEGRLVNPIEQEELDMIYTTQQAPINDIKLLEVFLCSFIDSDKLQMSLKLSNDTARLSGFLKNSLISDDLFLKLLPLYNWNKETFFENDENRDITSALIGRFYIGLEKNHNVQYASTGILHLISQSTSSDFIEKVASLEPLKVALRNGCDKSTYKILQAIASNKFTPFSVLKALIKGRDVGLNILIAKRENIDDKIQKLLFAEGNEAVLEALSCSSSLSIDFFEPLQKYHANIAHYIRLDQEKFDLLQAYAEDLAQNRSLTKMMIHALCKNSKTDVYLAMNPALDEEDLKDLLDTEESEVIINVAKNTSASKALIEQLFQNSETHLSLASNIATPSNLLEALYLKNDKDILLALAKNRATPIDILCQLQLDRHFDRAVKENETFGNYIQKDNIGWL